MKKRILQPEQIIVPGEYEIGNESILKIYFRVFDKGHGKNLPPAIVTTVGSFERLQDRLEEGYKRWEKKEQEIVAQRRDDYKMLFEILKQHPYILIDGNHKTAAATLTKKPIFALELQRDKDFEEIERMIERGEIFDFKRPERSLDELREGFVAHCLSLDDIATRYGLMGSLLPGVRYTKTIKERVNELASNGDLPQYMKDRYFEK